MPNTPRRVTVTRKEALGAGFLTEQYASGCAFAGDKLGRFLGQNAADLRLLARHYDCHLESFQRKRPIKVGGVN